jgi:hypothetical protein
MFQGTVPSPSLGNSANLPNTADRTISGEHPYTIIPFTCHKPYKPHVIMAWALGLVNDGISCSLFQTSHPWMTKSKNIYATIPNNH